MSTMHLSATCRGRLTLDSMRPEQFPAVMRRAFPRRILPSIAALALLCCAFSRPLRAAEIPKLGESAPAFALKSLDGERVRLADLTARGTVMLVVLRGWPGYQCPICNLQVNDFITARAGFAGAKVQVVFVYPGPAADLEAHAAEFRTMKGREWPAEYRYVLDPDYMLINAYGLRWDAPRETAYPSTFIIDAKGVVRFVKVSHTHGDRTKAADMLAELSKLAAP